MGTKRQHISRGRIVNELSPSTKHFFMAGWADYLPGWFEALVLIASDHLEATWRQHRDALIDEATAAGFVPGGVIWFERGTPPDYVDNVDVYALPNDPARQAWSQDFCRRHG